MRYSQSKNYNEDTPSPYELDPETDGWENLRTRYFKKKSYEPIEDEL
jgi:hypothetical protein